ncbi:class F sortase [Nocardioides sp. Kera G14]|uniref:class F sortase n=1 Tax=Nocardioides sp. Kera G14 TaxID=2884264 RepID=UPI001D11A2E8|nr:class F sortase [Nocardioides sp. Kera G14]UDY24694.1 class F sortase [Nocardioides sp. Kera G14]
MPEKRRSGLDVRRSAGVLAGLGLVAAGLVWQHGSTESVASGADAVVAARGAAGPPVPAARVVAAAHGAPRRVVIPALGVNAPVVSVEVAGGTLLPPADASTLGWWAGGAVPGSPAGSVLISGHTVHTGGGALEHLERLHLGDRVSVSTGGGQRVVYTVRRVGVYDKGLVARRAEALFEQGGPPRLVLVTCGDWDGTRFRSNVIVIATA